jgi:phosphoglycolate phosphatase-like HAD superfamily hydrolase
MAYRAALFDLDDTLVASVECKMLQHKVIAKRHYDVDITDEMLHKTWGKPLSTMIDLMYQSADTTERIMDVLYKTDQEFPKVPFVGAADALLTLLDAGIHVGIVTSAPTRVAMADLVRHHFPVEKLLCVLGEDAVVAAKPDPRVFDTPKALLQHLDIGTAEMVYVGDSFVDLQAASGATIDFIAVTTGLVQQHEFVAAGATRVTTGIVAAIDMIRGKV